jgi:tetratricopeptide (TPR) repeat protein
MGEHDEAVEDYEEAVRLDPKNDDLKADLEAAVEAAVEAKTTGVTNLKAEADGHFGKGQYSKAKDCYTKALRLAGGAHLGCLSNRAACHLMLGEDMQCVKDCTAAMEQLPGAALLSAEDGVEEVEEGEQAEEERKKTERTRLRLHVRRGTASARLGDVAGARADYVVAKELSTDAAELAQLERDLGKLLDPTGLDLD